MTASIKGSERYIKFTNISRKDAKTQKKKKTYTDLVCRIFSTGREPQRRHRVPQGKSTRRIVARGEIATSINDGPSIWHPATSTRINTLC